MTKARAEEMIGEGYKKYKELDQIEKVKISAEGGYHTTNESKRAALTLNENFGELKTKHIGLLHLIADAYRALDDGAKPSTTKK